MMKKYSIYKNDTSWLHGLLYFSLLLLVMFLVSTIVMVYQVLYYSNGSKNHFEYDVVVYPTTLVLTIFQVFSSVYFVWNYILWLKSYLKSFNTRKIFNLIALIFGGIVLFGVLIDCVLKLISIFSNLPLFITKFNDASESLIVGNNWKALFGKPFILLGFSLFGFIFFLIMHVIQLKKYKTEETENSLKDVQDHYRKLSMEKKKKIIKKQKHKDLSKKIRVF